ncbi:MAG: pyridoxal 5'-phosphate synthase glutaminase subunit PdxT, partial [Bryobacteraceae bacterium]
MGVLALQGDFEAHVKTLTQLGAEPVEVRKAHQFNDLDALIIPGGESTTMLKLLDEEGLFSPLMQFSQTKPIFGTCAG